MHLSYRTQLLLARCFPLIRHNGAVNSLNQLIEFLSHLQDEKITYRLDCVRDAIMVIVPSPSKYYEIEFFGDGHIEAQTFGPQRSVKTVTLDEILEAVIHDANG